jgi:hypothetical protein
MSFINLFLLIGLTLAFWTSGCQNYSRPPGRRVGGDGTNVPVPTKIPTKPIEEICEQQWAEFVEMSPSGRKTNYENVQTLSQGDTSIVIKQIFIYKTHSENTSEKVGWRREEVILSPEKSNSVTNTTWEKKSFVELCSVGIKFDYSERPRDFKPVLYKEELFKLEDKEFSVMYEKYVFSRSSLPADRDELHLWIGHKPPHKGLLFKKLRKYFIANPKLAEIRDLKELKALQDSP